MASANISFFVFTGAEIHWRQAKSFHGDAAGFRTLLYGSTGCIIAAGFLMAGAWVLMPYIYEGTGKLLHVLASSLRWMMCCRARRRPGRVIDAEKYQRVPGSPFPETDLEGKLSRALSLNDPQFEAAKKRTSDICKRIAILFPAVLLLMLRFIRPHESAYMYLSWALPLSPFTSGGSQTNSVQVEGLPGNSSWLVNRTALDLATPKDWMPLPKKELPGFTDWYPRGKSEEQRQHYSPAHDPLRLSNLNHRLLDPMKEALHDPTIKVKHVIVIKLESTRKDVFPFKKESYLWDKVQKTREEGKISSTTESILANLTRTSEFLTGDDSGFNRDDTRKARGGISASNAYTTSTYTLKSLTGTLCGISPLVADFNREFDNHIYQPCMSHVLELLSRQGGDQGKKSSDFKMWPWKSMWMQSVTDSYDNQRALTKAMGFRNSRTKESLRGRQANHGPPKSKEINYYGYPDTELRPYLKDAIRDAEKNHERLFLTHLTGTTHHPWGLPGSTYKDIVGDRSYKPNRKFNRYLNTIGFVDDWLQEILDILEETGIANETLLVLAGDHGLSLPDDGGITPYDNPHVGNFHVPIVFSHPLLPHIEITEPVTSLQILPTMLDLLIESKSLTPRHTDILRHLLPIYEGQSILRPLVQKASQDPKGPKGVNNDAHRQNPVNNVVPPPDRPDWQFTVMNTGGSWLAMRSATAPYRLVVPLVADVEWRFTDLETDPHEESPIMEFDQTDIAHIVKTKHGEKAEKWLGQAAHVAKWWVEENRRRWRWNPADG